MSFDLPSVNLKSPVDADGLTDDDGESKTETEKGVKDSDCQGVSSTLGNERGRGGGAEESGQFSVVELFHGLPSPFTD